MGGKGGLGWRGGGSVQIFFHPSKWITSRPLTMALSPGLDMSAHSFGCSVKRNAGAPSHLQVTITPLMEGWIILNHSPQTQHSLTLDILP